LVKNLVRQEKGRVSVEGKEKESGPVKDQVGKGKEEEKSSVLPPFFLYKAR